MVPTPTAVSAPPVKLFVAMLMAESADRSSIVSMLEEVFGSSDLVGDAIPFDVTNYYEGEMGTNLARSVISFTGPHYADALVPAKLACIELEKGLAVEGRRTVNLDVGYLDHSKIVLASTKEAGQKLYVSDGIYADLVARYSQGAYRPFEWSFPDFKDGRYTKTLEALRRNLLESIKQRE